jgi:protein TonB
LNGSASRSSAARPAHGHYRHWAGSLVLHGGLAALLVLSVVRPHVPAPQVSQWDVAMVESATPAAQPAPAPKPEPTPQPVRRIEPIKPSPAPKPIPKAVLQPTGPQPEPPKPQLVAPPPAPAPVVAAPMPAPQPAVRAAPMPVEAKPEPPLADSAWLGHTLWGLMNSHKRYPLLARRMGAEGKVVIEAVIDSQGHILSAQVVQSSGSPILDDDAMTLLKSVTPLKLERFRLADRTTVRIPMVYALD